MNSPWILKRSQPDPSLVRLVCLPHAGGGAASYVGWSLRLAPQIEVLAVQLPGREARLSEPPIADMHELVDALTAALAPHCRTPFALFGHSMGAHVAFELVRTCRRRDLPLPTCLIVSGARAPHLPHLRPALGQLPDSQFLRSIEQRYGTRFEPDMADLIDLLLPTLRADIQVVENHIHLDEPPLAIPIVAFAGADDRSVPLSDARQWGRHTCHAFEFKVFPGGHFFPATLGDQFLSSLSRVLTRYVLAESVR
jgi:medium-chain acyl-[acyl-carrier-protein] hydrolase